MTTQVSNGVAKQVTELGREHPGLASSKDNLFVLWFLQAYVVGEDDKNLEASVVGAAKDGGFDAIYIDSRSKIVHLVQGKYRRGFGAKPEPTVEIDRFLRDSEMLYSDDRGKFDEPML